MAGFKTAGLSIANASAVQQKCRNDIYPGMGGAPGAYSYSPGVRLMHGRMVLDASIILLGCMNPRNMRPGTPVQCLRD